MSQTDAKAPGEGQIPIQQLMQLMPDIFTPQGLEDLNQKLNKAKSEQDGLDTIFKPIAKGLNADYSSRIKNHSTTLKKIAQKRLEPGRQDYGIKDIGDALGGRITLEDESKMPQAIQVVKKASDKGLFTINKEQHIKDDTHDSEHFDITLPTGQQAELQILPNPQELANSVVGHDIYQTYGENPPPEAQAINKMQTKVVDSLPNHKAKQLADNVLQMHKSNADMPLPPIVTAKAVANAKS